MLNISLFDSFMNSQDVLRERFFIVLKSKPATIYRLSKDIGIARPTINRFIKLHKDISFVSLCKIEKYIIKKENENLN